jgi:hypothetical protein
VCAGAAKLLGGLQTFKVRYAEARAKDHPELAQLYADKIKAMKAAGELTVLDTAYQASLWQSVLLHQLVLLLLSSTMPHLGQRLFELQLLASTSHESGRDL